MCESQKTRPFAHGYDHEYENTPRDNYTFVECDNCGHIYLNPRPAVSELSTIYPPNYYSYIVAEKRAEEFNKTPSFLGKIFRARNLSKFKKFASKLFEGKTEILILDVGCGDGTTLNYWKEVLGSRVRTYGVEIGEKAAAIARKSGHNITISRFEDCDFQNLKFDFIYSFHVIEHVEDPKYFMRKCRQLLKPDGHLMIDTPEIASFDAKVFRKGLWGGYHFPRHWNLYSAESFRNLADMTDFKIDSVSYYSIAVFWIWTCHAWLHPKFPKLANILFPPVNVIIKSNLWNFFLLSFFTLVEYLLMALKGRTSAMRILLSPK
jgi:2-polyprenyl-3-methyl-5-hydroxy-6-metoxy-1,4-benzoquinol methylase